MLFKLSSLESSLFNLSITQDIILGKFSNVMSLSFILLSFNFCREIIENPNTDLWVTNIT